MLCVRRRDGQKLEIEHNRTGDIMILHVHKFRQEAGKWCCDLVIDASPREFLVRTPERKSGTAPTPD